MNVTRPKVGITEDILQILLLVFLSFLMEDCTHLTVLTVFTALIEFIVFIGYIEDLNKLAKLQAKLVRNYDLLTDRPTGVKCRATSVAKKYRLLIHLLGDN